jgi:type II secretory pathway predicted ATPase ExeA
MNETVDDDVVKPNVDQRRSSVYSKHFELNDVIFCPGLMCSKLYRSEAHQEVLSRLVFVAERKLFAVVTGECGSGKTTILRDLKDSLDEKNYVVLYLADSKLTPRNFYNGLLGQLGRERSFFRGDSRRKLHQEIEYIREVRHRKLVVIVDEAHLLNREMLEELRFLLNFKMDSESPLALILSGQNELEENLDRRSSTAIRQRINYRCRLAPLSLAETGEYIEHHLQLAGSKNKIFLESAVSEIFSYSAGYPRLINKACVSSLMYGFTANAKVIDGNMVKAIIENELN